MSEAPVEAWQALAERAVAETRAALPRLGGAALAFHSVADGIVHLNGPRVARLLAEVGGPAELTPLLDQSEPPELLRDPHDLAAALLFALQRGQALQRMIADVGLHRWLLEKLGVDEPRLGGTSANMASAVARLGVNPTIVYAYPPSRRVASLFPGLPNLQVFTGGPENPLLPVGEWAARLPVDESPEAPLHWILEYGPEVEVTVGDTRVRPPRANRFIAGWNPANRHLKLEPAFLEGLHREAGGLDFFFLSGYHILAEGEEGGERGQGVSHKLDQEPDQGTGHGTDHVRAVGSTADLVARVRRVNPRCAVHLELASIGSAAVRREVVHQVLPRVDSAGLNEAELETLAADTGIPWTSPGRGADRLVKLGRLLIQVSRATGLGRIHAHDLGNYLLVLQEGQGEERASAALRGLLYAGAVAATRARSGDLSPDSGEKGLLEPFAPEGLERLETLDDALTSEGADRRGLGLWRLEDRWMVAAPTRVVNRPLRTVGLGDTISASALLSERALCL